MQKIWKSRFWQAFVVGGTQTLVQIYNTGRYRGYEGGLRISTIALRNLWMVPYVTHEAVENDPCAATIFSFGNPAKASRPSMFWVYSLRRQPLSSWNHINQILYVVNFDQLTHANQNSPGATSFWVSTGIWESLLNAKNADFSSCCGMSLTWASHVHDEKSTFLTIFECFSLFSTIQTHAQACVCWLKYTTVVVLFFIWGIH